MKNILIELKAKTESEVSSLIEELNKSKLLEIDFDYKAVPIRRRKRKSEPTDETFIIRGKALEDNIEKLSSIPFIVRIWNDTKIEHFCFICNSSIKGTLDDAAKCIGAKQLWDKGYKGNGIVVGIVDGGVDKKVIPQVINGSNPDWGNKIYWDGHGNMTSTDVLGIAPDIQIYDLRIATEPNGTLSALISNALSAYDWALQQYDRDGTPHILSNSWGIFQKAGDPDYATNPNHPFSLKVEEVLDKGIKVVFAAGNCGETCPDSRCINLFPFHKDTGGGRSIWGVNGHEEVMTIGAVKLNNNRLKYSSQGPAALSDRKPDFCGYSSFRGYYWNINSGADSGTSAACPVVAGAVALLLNYNSNLTQSQIKDLLQRTAKDIEDFGFDYNTGYGVVRIDNAYYELEPTQKPKEDFRDKLCDYVYNIDRRCARWADEGSRECSQWADEGSNQCTGFVGWICKSWYWVAKWVCKGWYWVAKWVCKLYVWIITSITFTNCNCR